MAYELLRLELLSRVLSCVNLVQAAEASKPKDIPSEGVENISTESQNTTDEDRPDIKKEEASASNEASGCKEDIVFNPNVLTEFKLAGCPELFF